MKIFLLLFLFVTNVFATDNAIKMGYNFVTVSQDVVFNNTMRTGGALSLSALVADGGGRNPGDPFTMKMVFYDSNNQILSTVQQSWTLILGAAAAPYTITTPNCGGSCANVSRVNVQFYGKDGGYWAGNYGPYIQSPSLTFNNGGNILYNPEFGIYSGNTFAQGWTSSNGWQNCQLYSGAQTCVVNNGAPVNGGNYSATGGSTSGTAGGYSTTPPPPPAVTITTEQQNKITAARARQTLSNQVNVDQIGSYNNTDVIQSGYYHLVDVVILGDNNNTDISQTGVKNYSKVGADGSNNNTNVYQSNSGGAGVTGHFSEILITGSNNTTNVTQTGDAEKVNFTSINGNNNSVTNNQFGTGSKYSDIKAVGNGHTVVLDQKDGGSHAARIEVTNNGGASNINVLQQGNTTQNYLLQQSCATVGGCSLTIIQQ
jgi:hypothetical protein